ncbi:hypothetical protein CNX70_21975 [Janthinobacterium svalbardensis]|uniref:Uncharacterized protein n=2 Tax=Janthinobacterium svalbardensis TaxID=368607 RepID=A0A290X0W5_9BURK|nr:hypothetical protein CNX70_21975 [Janthinobacterium svalbardensis]
MLLTALLPTTYMLATYNAEPAPAVAPPPRTGTPDRPATMAYAPILYVDNETGCHYLTTDALQALVPRMDRDGKQVCLRPAGAQPSQPENK